MADSGDDLAEVEPENGQGAQNTEEVGQEHLPGILPEPDAEIAGGDDVGEVGDHQRVGGGIPDKSPGHQKGEDRDRVHLEVLHLGQQDRCEDQSRPVVGKQRGDDGTQDEDIEEHQMAVAPGEFGHLERGPFEEADLVQGHGEQDDPDKGQGRVPDDGRNVDNVAEIDDTEKQGGKSPQQGAGPDLEPFGLPDDQDKRDQEDGRGKQHGTPYKIMLKR